MWKLPPDLFFVADVHVVFVFVVFLLGGRYGRYGRRCIPSRVFMLTAIVYIRCPMLLLFVCCLTVVPTRLQVDAERPLRG